MLDYFAGERAEMLIAIAAVLVVAASAAWLYLSSRSGFAMAIMMTVVLFGGVMAAGLASLMIRDRGASRVLTHTLQTNRYATAIAGEKARVSVVLAKFKYYRFGAVVLGVLAMAGLLLSGRGWIHGVAAGLLLVVFAQVVIDHFAEQRAHGYFEKLTAAYSN